MKPSDAGAAIEVQVDKVAQLFHTLDPVPFRERDLDREAEDFIVGWARELPRALPIRVVVHLPESEAKSADARELAPALKKYFAYRAGAMTNELKELFRIGRLSLTIGLVSLAICLTLGRLILTSFPNSEFPHVVNEGLVILGWVANWRPMNIFLYEWWPLARRRHLYRRLAGAEVTLAPR